jgi:hypothetical protein
MTAAGAEGEAEDPTISPSTQDTIAVVTIACM